MPIIATNKGGVSFPLIEAGTYAARCYGMIYIGTVKEAIPGKDKEEIQQKIRVYWELPTELFEFKEGDGKKPYVVDKEYTLSLGEKANLRKVLVSWRGEEFTKEELDGFDVTKVIGAPCTLALIHKKTAKGREYVDVASVSKLVKGTILPKQINPRLELNYDNFDFTVFNHLPEFIKDKMKTSVEYQNMIASQEHYAQAANLNIAGMPNILEEPDNDDLPF